MSLNWLNYHLSYITTLQFIVQRLGMLQSSPAHGWLGSQGSSSSLIVKKTIRVDIPVDKYPTVCYNPCALVWSLVSCSAIRLLLISYLFLQYNFVGRLLGPRGNSLKRVEASTDCRVLIRGHGSIKDPTRVSSMIIVIIRSCI